MENTTLPDEPILRRAFMFLADRDWQNAFAYADRALDGNPENCRAYICRLLCELGINDEKFLKYADVDFGVSKNYQNALKFADKQQLEYLEQALQCAKENESKRLAEKEQADRISNERWLIEQKIKDEENIISSCYREENEIAENNKLKILGGIYILFFLIFVGGIASAGINMIMLAVCMPVGYVGIWTLHSVMCYADETTYSKFIAFGLGPVNLASLGIWGLVKSIKKFTLKNPAKKSELNKTMRECLERKAQFEKELEDFDLRQKNKSGF